MLDLSERVRCVLFALVVALAVIPVAACSSDGGASDPWRHAGGGERPRRAEVRRQADAAAVRVQGSRRQRLRLRR